MHQTVQVKGACRRQHWLSRNLTKISRRALLLGLLWPLAGTGEEASPPAPQVALDGEYLTIEAAEVPHRRIMEAVAEALEIELVLNDPFDDPRTVSVRHVPWQEGLEKALFPANWAIVYDRSSQPWRVTKVIVLGSGGGFEGGAPKIDSQARLPAKATSDAEARRRERELEQEEVVEEVVVRIEEEVGMSLEEVEKFANTLLGLEGAPPGELSFREMLKDLEPEELEKMLQEPEPEELEKMRLE